jgi:hypothetical protein
MVAGLPVNCWTVILTFSAAARVVIVSPVMSVFSTVTFSGTPGAMEGITTGGDSISIISGGMGTVAVTVNPYVQSWPLPPPVPVMVIV